MKKLSHILNFTSSQLVDVFSREFESVAIVARQDSDHKWFMSWITDYISQCKATSGDSAQWAEDMIAREGTRVNDLSTGDDVHIETFAILHAALRNERLVSADFMLEMIHLFTRLRGTRIDAPAESHTRRNFKRWESGLDERIVAQRERNKIRITDLLIERISNRSPLVNKRFFFPDGISRQEQRDLIGKWWGDFRFHLAMAIRSPRELNKYLDNSLSEQVMETLANARRKEMPFFITPYYASLLDTSGLGYDDRTIRSYIIYSLELVEAYGGIRAWEKEDILVDGQPNAAGWILPHGGNIHRRYPDVAILIPDSMGRACGGLCAPCQRMYDFQSKHLNFEFGKLKPNELWDSKLRRLMRWYEQDEQLRDILITGGDALMSQNSTIRNILNAVLRMAARKRIARTQGKQIATIDRVRLGSRMPAYLPMRINDELIEILRIFRERGQKIGISQFVIQTHYESPLEITLEARQAIRALLSAGWIITNQLVFTVPASRRGHSAALRRELLQQGVLPYYTFTVKGFSENYALFTPNSRSLQEMAEEKAAGEVDGIIKNELISLLDHPERLHYTIRALMRRHDLPFISTDRNVMNLPGIGKSMTFQTAGITADGRRILCFDHDHTRTHSPMIDSMGRVYITEAKSLGAYLRQLHQMGENVDDYSTLWNYTSGNTEARFPIYEYPVKV